MTKKAILLAFAAALPGVAFAQSSDGDKPSDQIACELEDTCSAPDDSAADSAAPAPATRSWSWGNRASTTATPTARQPARAGNLATTGSRADRAALAKTYGAKSSRLAISFANNSDELTPAGRRQADELYKAISARAMAGGRYMIAGHTDASGSHDLNVDLSRRRAQTLVDYLVEKGIPRDHFRARGYGFDRPLQGTSPSAAVNRRVEVTKLN